MNSPTASHRAGFTLIELMTVVLVISILASTILFAMYGAVQEAKEARTRTQIARINDLIMTRWESYRTRPIRVRSSVLNSNNPNVVATARLNALRDLMRMELPDRKADIADDPVSGIPRPAVSLRFKRIYDANEMTWTKEYEDAECLYLILQSINENGTNGLDFIHESEIGDKDGDGMLEIWDAWGTPLAFLRWPAGYVEHHFVDSNNVTHIVPSYSNLQTADPVNFPDPFNPLKVQQRSSMTPSDPGIRSNDYLFNFALFPLIASAGPDTTLDLVRFDGNPTDPNCPNYHYNRNVPPLASPAPPPTQPHFNTNWPQNDPYAVMPATNRRLGEPICTDPNTGARRSGYADNITNHLVEIK